MNQHVAPIERIDPETGEVAVVSAPSLETPDPVEAPADEAVAVPDAEKRKFPLQPVLKQAAPPLPTPAADRIDDNWGIARFATRGAMHVERYFVMSEKLLWPSIIIAVLSLVLMASPMMSGMSAYGGGGSSGGAKLITAFLPFWIIGCAVTWVFFTSIDGGSPDGEYIVFGGVLLGGVLFWLWLEGASDPNGTAAWIITAAKIIFGVGLILWVAHHIRKSVSTGESRAILWMAGGYVFLVVVGTLVLGSLATAMSGFGPGGMQTIQSMLTYDRNTYFDVGGGLRSGPEDRWMADYSPQGGLSVIKLNALIKAVQTDIANHGDDAASWEEVTKLQTQPMITRAEKAIRDNAKELPNGIIILPKDGGPVSLVAYVEGQWSISLVASQACLVALGPFDEESGCQNQNNPERPLSGYARQILDQIKPTPAETKE